jgi:hypothetical protein
MEWAILLFLAVVIGIHWWEYSNTVQEYTIAQPTGGRIDRQVLSDKTPVPFEVGPLPWRPEVAEKAGWNAAAVTEGPDGDMEMAETIGLPTGLTELDDSRAWWWLPGLFDVQVGRIGAGGLMGLSWVGAERRWLGCSHGGPMTVWLVHSRYRRYLPKEPVNPWTLTVAEAPWIGRVQYIELVVRPGWCVGLPAHWGYAVQADAKEGAWWWVADQHSSLSWGLTHSGDVVRDIMGKIQPTWPSEGTLEETE